MINNSILFYRKYDMCKIKRKLDRVLNVRIDDTSYDKLQRLFYNRPDEYKDKLRNMSEFIRWVVLNWVNLQRNVDMRRENYFSNGVM